jgi:hypothetical protein
MGLAWQTICHAWVIRWAGILGAGALPAVAAALFPRLKGHRLFSEFRSAASLVALLQCVLASPLVLDTFRVEGQSQDALVSQSCRVTFVQESADKIVLDCVGATVVAPTGPDVTLKPGDMVQLHKLQTTGLPVLAEKG